MQTITIHFHDSKSKNSFMNDRRNFSLKFEIVEESSTYATIERATGYNFTDVSNIEQQATVYQVTKGNVN